MYSIMRNCVVPGSFDPFTLGHLDIVRRASVLFDRVYVAVMINSSKQGFFDFVARKKIAEVSCSGIPNVEVITAEGVLCDLCRSLGACAIVKGIRNAADYVYECELADINRHLDTDIETVWLASRTELAYISSTCVREFIKYNKPLYGVVHPDAAKLIYGMSGQT